LAQTVAVAPAEAAEVDLQATAASRRDHQVSRGGVAGGRWPRSLATGLPSFLRRGVARRARSGEQPIPASGVAAPHMPALISTAWHPRIFACWNRVWGTLTNIGR
jgi:hypothetical protein